jgi:phosphoglycerate dehydrogenase-like enzyme
MTSVGPGAKSSRSERRISRPFAAADRPIHLHIENTGSLGEVFEVTRKRLREALLRHPTVAGRIKVTLGCDGDVYERALRTADVLFGWSFDRRNLARRAPRLKWVHAHGAGVNHLFPLDWLPQGAVLTNSRGVHGVKASEYAIMAVLALNNRLPEIVTNHRRATWRQLYNTSIAGKTLLIVGVGSVGGTTARVARQFGLRVLGIRRTGRSHRHVDEMFRPTDLAGVLPRADFVLITAPHTQDTHHMIDARMLDRMKRGAGLVNYSRAHLVDYEALCRKLERGELAAVLDVFDPEPLPPDSPLWHVPNLLITPHSSSDDANRYTPDTLDLLLRNVARLLEGKPLLNRVRPELGY